jgi:beta-glucosidase
MTRSRLLAAVVTAWAVLGGGWLTAEEKPAYLDHTLPVDQRVEDLVSRMTLEEKVHQMASDAEPIDRLGVAQYNWWNECLHGVGRAGLATVFPQAIGLAATWDTAHMHRVATAISDEARAKHHDFVRRGKRGIYEGLTFWTPNINIFRDPRWGRGMETYGEDPFLTGRMAVAFVKGLQGDHPKYLKTVATVKHFAVHSGPEPDRHHFNAVADERDLRETYLPHFRTAISEGGAQSLMSAYNRYHWESATGSYRFLTSILRDEWGFDGYVVSDCGAVTDIWRNHQIAANEREAASLAVKAGCDLNCGISWGPRWQIPFHSLNQAVAEGLITEEQIDISLRRLFRARFRLGEFDPPGQVPYRDIPLDVVDSDEHRALARETARKSIVLLRNEDATLPLRKDLGTLAVIGPNADDVEVLLANYNGNPADPVTPLEGIRRKLGDGTRVLHARGSEWAEGLPYLVPVPGSALFTTVGGRRVPGLTAEYFDNRALEGDPVKTEVVPELDFNWWDRAPLPGLDDDDFGARYTGELVPHVSGTHALGGYGFSAFKLYLDGDELVSFRNRHHPAKQSREVELEAGRSYALRLDYSEWRGDAHIALLWAPPPKDLAAEAVAVARQADVVVMFMGLSPRLEGEEMNVPVEGFEGGDRVIIGLPAVQQQLIERIHALGKPTVLVLLSGSALAVTWADENIPAIVQAWYPGQAAGEAIADVLFGDYNPAGRLPVTFYRSVDQLPPFESYRMEGRTYRYFEGEPLYAFGHGLSYTRFGYSDLHLPASVLAGQGLRVSVEVENTGPWAGDEVVQLYLTDVEAHVPVPRRTLAGFERVSLEPGEKRSVSFEVSPRQLSLIDPDWRRVIVPGTFEVAVGGGQPGGAADVVVGRFEVTGDVVPVD